MPSNVADQQVSWFDSFREVLERLSTADPTTITDLAGREYTVPARLSARRQLQTLGALEGLLGQPAFAGTMASVQRAEKTVSGVATMVTRLLHLARSEEAIDSIDAVFVSAYPGVLNDARKNAGADGQGLRATDLFELQEIVVSLLPFSARPVMRLMNLARDKTDHDGRL